MNLGVIPVRMSSTRFPGKPLTMIAGKPMVQRVYERVIKAKSLNEIIIATDSPEIIDFCDVMGYPVILTEEAETGSDRVAQAVVALKDEGWDINLVVNIQGDEPLIDPYNIDLMINGLRKYAVGMTNAVNGYSLLTNKEDVLNPNIVKVIMDKNENALAFSRYPLPYIKSKNVEVERYRQLGLYAYTLSGILLYHKQSLVTAKPGPLEMAEGIEMYRLLENGHNLRMIRAAADISIPVDVPEDVAKVEAILKRIGEANVCG